MATYDYDYLEKRDYTKQQTPVLNGVDVVGINFINGDAILSNNDLKRIGKPENLIQRIIKFLRTEKNLYRIYEAELNDYKIRFGWLIFETIGHTYTSVTLSKYSNEIRTFLNGQYDIENVESILLKPVEDKILITIVLTSIYEEITIKEVIEANYYLYGEGA